MNNTLTLKQESDASTRARSRCLSVSKKNKAKYDIAEDYALQWGMDIAPTIFRIIGEYDTLTKKIKDSKWAIMQDLLS